MATIVVRGLERELVKQLKVVAACNGRSMEEEVRFMLRERVSPPSPRPLAVTLMSIPGYGWEWPR